MFSMAQRKSVTRKDVTERAGVSVAVVSYVVNDSAGIAGNPGQSYEGD